MKFRETLRSLGREETLPVAAELLRLLEGGEAGGGVLPLLTGSAASRALPTAEELAGPLAAERGGAAVFSTERVTERLEAPRRMSRPDGILPAEGRNPAEESGAAASETRGVWAFGPGTSAFGDAAGVRVPETERGFAAGSDMDAISEYFRRDSRRYDNGFGV